MQANTAQPVDPDQLLTRDEAAGLLRLHPRTVDRLRDLGKIKCVRVGRRRLYRRAEIRRYQLEQER